MQRLPHFLQPRANYRIAAMVFHIGLAIGVEAGHFDRFHREVATMGLPFELTPRGSPWWSLAPPPLSEVRRYLANFVTRHNRISVFDWTLIVRCPKNCSSGGSVYNPSAPPWRSAINADIGAPNAKLASMNGSSGALIIRPTLIQTFTGAGAALMWLVAAVLPTALASWLGSFVVGILGPCLRKHGHIVRNLQIVHPRATREEVQSMARAVWRSAGSVVFEYPHLRSIFRTRVTVNVAQEVRQLVAQGVPFMVVGGHLANWEVIAGYMGDLATPAVAVYAPHDNPWIERLVQRFRRVSGCRYVTKGEWLAALARQRAPDVSVALLGDTRVDTGVPVELFGVPAPTTVSPARLALSVGYPYVPVRVERVGVARYRIDLFAPLTAPALLNGKSAAIDVTRQFNAHLERWIAERPGDWFCLKRRWPKNVERPAVLDDVR